MKKIRILLAVVLALGLIVGVGGIVLKNRDYSSGRQDYDDAVDIGQVTISTTKTVVPEASDESASPVDDKTDDAESSFEIDNTATAETVEQAVDLAALQAVSPEVIGWLSIPGTQVSYPLLQGTDNDYYLTHTWNGEANSVGAIFMDYRSSADLTDFNTLIYGHNMKDDSMFSSLRSYEDGDFYIQAPAVLLTDENGTHHYRIFAAYMAKTDAALYTPGLNDGDYARQVLEFAVENSVMNVEIRPTGDDHILTLVTCGETDNTTRWIVQAVLDD